MLDAVRAVEKTLDPAQKVRLAARALWMTRRFDAVVAWVTDRDTAVTDVVPLYGAATEPDVILALRRAAARYVATGRWDPQGTRRLRAFPLWPTGHQGVIAVALGQGQAWRPTEELAVTRFTTAVGVSVEQAWASRRDPLTGCFTGAACRAELKRRLFGAPLRPCGVVYCDMDDLKQINDRWGHAAGDRAIGAVAQGLRVAAERDLRTRWVGRLHGDEFLIVFWADPGTNERQLRERLSERWRSTVPGVSIGVAVRRAGDDAAGLVRRAEASMYRDKARGRGLSRATP